MQVKLSSRGIPIWLVLLTGLTFIPEAKANLAELSLELIRLVRTERAIANVIAIEAVVDEAGTVLRFQARGAATRVPVGARLLTINIPVQGGAATLRGAALTQANRAALSQVNAALVAAETYETRAAQLAAQAAQRLAQPTTTAGGGAIQAAARASSTFLRTLAMLARILASPWVGAITSLLLDAQYAGADDSLSCLPQVTRYERLVGSYISSTQNIAQLDCDRGQILKTHPKSPVLAELQTHISKAKESAGDVRNWLDGDGHRKGVSRFDSFVRGTCSAWYSERLIALSDIWSSAKSRPEYTCDPQTGAVRWPLRLFPSRESTKTSQHSEEQMRPHATVSTEVENSETHY